MKKFLLITLSLLLVLSAAMLYGCTPDKDGAEPAFYWNADKGMQRTPDADGSYQVTFLLNGELVTYRVPNEEMMLRIDAQKAVGLTVDRSGTVTDVAFLADMPQYYLAFNYTVQSMGKNTVKLNSMVAFNGSDVMLKLDENTPILDVSDYAAVKGAPTTLQKGDGVTVIANGDGSINTVFVDARQGITSVEKRYCPICDKEVEFTNWFSSASMPFTSGHYYLERDIDLSKATTVTSGEITLDLNGKTVTMITEGQRFYTLSGEDVILNVIDTVGNGKAVVASAGNGPYKNGMFVRMDGVSSVFNLYSGTLDATDSISEYGCLVDNYQGVFNMYGGTLLGGTTYGVGGGAIIVQSVVNIYDGEIIGGYCADDGTPTPNPPGGGCIRHNGADKILNIYGGTISGGKTDFIGGCVYINGITNISGGTITGGSAEMAGGGVYVSADAQLTVSGNPNITGNEDGDIYLVEGKGLTVGEAGLSDAKLGIDMKTPGVFTLNAVAKDQVGCFTSTNGKIVRNANGTLSLK